MTKIAPFLISYVDNLGQGVSKIGDKITIIKKTLPGDSGQCIIFHEMAKVAFGKVSHFEQKSDKHDRPICPHYDECQGCHYLHTDYKTEISLKEKSYGLLFSSLIPATHIKTVKADQRSHYRNRIQLHYDKRKKIVGFKDRKEIISVTNCLMASLAIQKKLEELLQGQLWTLLGHEKNNGHFELYEKENEVKLSINDRYASGGFSQVNLDMNQKLLTYVKEKTASLSSKHYVIDLFGGNGNLSAHLDSETLVVDGHVSSTSGNRHQTFSQIDLYGKNAVTSLQNELSDKPIKCLILDPPRSGLKNIVDFIDLLNPEEIIYISCNPQTQKRDLVSLKELYDIESITFFDLFPSTYHLESAAHLKRKKVSS